MVALFVYLVIEADQRHTRAELLGLLWPEMSEEKARNNLRVLLTRLRKTLGPLGKEQPTFVESNRHEVWFAGQDKSWLDVAEFQRLVAATYTHPHSRRATCAHCQQILEEAAQLYRGELLRGFHVDGCPAFEEWLLIRRESCHLQAIELLEELSYYHEQRTDYAKAEETTRRQIQLDPLQEGAQRRLMRLLALQGQRSAALEQFALCQEILRTELAVEPEDETLWLVEEIRAGKLSPLPPEAQPEAQSAAQPTAQPEAQSGESETDSEPSTNAPPPSPAAAQSQPPPSNLPSALTPFFGREDELSQLAARLDESTYRLLTIVGPGGIGKTRLAIQAARQNQHRFADGIFFISLADLARASEIPSAILTALQVASIGGSETPEEQLLAYLAPRQLLLLLDNLEHLMDGVELFAEILAQAPNVTMLVTSREELPLQAADLFTLGGLSTPAELNDPQAKQHASIRLFAERAKRIDKSFRLDEQTLPHVVELCQLFEGLPLAIELATSIVRDYTIEEIVVEIREDTSLLSTHHRDVRSQHRSVQAVFDYSWDLLSAQEQRILAQLALFRGGFDIQSAKAVTGATRLLISQLRYKSLLQSRGSGRFDLHFLVRQMAQTKLNELAIIDGTLEPDTVRHVHSRHFLSALIEMGNALVGWTPAQAKQRLRPDLDNIRQAWQCALKEQAWDLLAEATKPLDHFYDLNGDYTEAETCFIDALAQFRLETKLQPDSSSSDQIESALLMAISRMMWRQSKYGETQRYIPQLISAATESENFYALAYTDFQIGMMYIDQGERELARAHLKNGLDMTHKYGFADLEGLLFRASANIARQQGDYERFEDYLTKALIIQKELQNAAEVQTILTWIGIYRRNQGDIWRGRGLLEEAMSMNEQIQEPFREATILAGLALADLDIGAYNTCLESLTGAIQIYEELNDSWHVIWAKIYVTLVHFYQGNYAEAIRHARQAIQMAEAEHMQEHVARGQIVLGYALASSEQHVEAMAQFELANEAWKKMENTQLHVEAQAGLAASALSLSKTEMAEELLEPIVNILLSEPLHDSVAPYCIYWNGYLALSKLNDERASSILEGAYNRIQSQAQQIDNEEAAMRFHQDCPIRSQLTVAWLEKNY